MPLRIVLLGTGEFALPAFQMVIESEHHVAAVYTQPERTGRGHHRHVNKVKVLAEQYGIRVRQPVRVNQQDVLHNLSAFAADLFLVAAYGQILKPELLAIPRLGAFNLHGSLLPRHRGAAPVQYAIRKGDKETGVTVFQIEPTLDSGPIVGQVTTPISAKDTSGKLMHRLADMSGPLMLDVVSQLEAGTAVFQTQDESQVTLAPKIGKDEGHTDWTRSASEIDCHVRAMNPWPKANTTLSWGETKLRCILMDVEPVTAPSSSEPGTVLESGKRLLIATGSGALRIHRIQPDGKQAMDAVAFANGYRVNVGLRFG